MKFIKTVNLSGTVTVEETEVSVAIVYKEPEHPTEAQFNFSDSKMSVNGTCKLEGITFYSVQLGVVTDEFMNALEIELIKCLTDYATLG